MSDKPNCYRCIHRREVPGSRHSACHHPDTAAVHADTAAQLVGLVGRRSGVTIIACEALKTLHITGAPHGIHNGWFIWPVNFDPAWLQTCEGFAAFPTKTAEADTAVVP